MLQMLQVLQVSQMLQVSQILQALQILPGTTDVTGITDVTGNNECEFMPPPNSSKCPDDSMSTTLQISQDNGDDEILHNNYKSQSLIKNLLP